MRITQEIILEYKEQGISVENIFNDLEFDWFPYEKYGDTVLVFRTESSLMNIPFVDDLGKDIHDGTRKGYEDTREFVEYLAKRIVLLLNGAKGETNEEIEKKTVRGKNGL